MIGGRCNHVHRERAIERAGTGIDCSDSLTIANLFQYLIANYGFCQTHSS